MLSAMGFFVAYSLEADCNDRLLASKVGGASAGFLTFGAALGQVHAGRVIPRRLVHVYCLGTAMYFGGMYYKERNFFEDAHED